MSFRQWFEDCEADVKRDAKAAKLDVSKYDPKELHAGYETEKEHDGKEGKDVDVWARRVIWSRSPLPTCGKIPSITAS